MSAKTLRDYPVAPKDTVDRFHGNQLVYIGWDHHQMFCSPVAFPLPPDMPFTALVEQVLPGAYSLHPDFAQIQWNQVQWLLDGQPFTPNLSVSLKGNGVGHKSVIRFNTPGLNGIAGSGS